MKLRNLEACLGQDFQDLVWLAERVGSIGRAHLFLRELQPSILKRILNVLLDYPKGYPVPYILREIPFYGRCFYVDERVLIPRSETETLIDLVLKYHPNPRRMVDVGTGSGVLGITLKILFPTSEVILTDISKEALEVAKINAQRFNVEVLLVRTDLLSGLGGRYDLIVSNPPYIARSELGKYDRRILFEPRKALIGGEMGYEITLKLIREALGMLKDDGVLIFESDPHHFQTLSEIAKNVEFSGRFVIVRP
ncbi:MAG: peptide chain release factor N(5)-glutamine methyltransferase [Thermotogae bacterium]|nr:peptide chain release factor N(5)-glutamine methyltransferase [Thermotogota bacterium]